MSLLLQLLGFRKVLVGGYVMGMETMLFNKGRGPIVGV